jgi:hypothetical protein
VIGAIVGEEPTPVARHRPGVERPEILERVGDAGEGPIGQARLHGGARLVVEARDDRVERRIAGLDPRDGGLEHFHRRRVSTPDQLGEAETVMLLEVHESAHARGSSSGDRAHTYIPQNCR